MPRETNLTELGAFLKEVAKHAPRPKERTLFSLGGREHYENPASDLLAFFLSPGEAHGFKALFLQTFLECMQLEPADFDFTDVTVNREEQTHEGGRIDLVLRGLGWILLIENKIYHEQVNPFASYEAYGRSRLDGKTPLMAILSPEGKSVDPKWKAVSYKDYCAALRNRFAIALFEQAYSKWVVFAREFVLHLENELYQPLMKNEQAEFAEQHWDQIEQVTKMASEYRVYLAGLLKGELAASLPGGTFSTADHGWAIRCYEKAWGRSNLAFFSWPSDVGRKFYVSVYLVDITREQETLAQIRFQGSHKLVSWREGKWFGWKTEPGFGSRVEAVAELRRLGNVLAEVFAPPPDPEQLTAPLPQSQS
jgi:hypothetical protein